MMKNCMEYKGYYGSIEYSNEDRCFYGKVLGIRSLILFEGTNVQELEDSFHQMLDEYLEDCREAKTEPEKIYKGSFNIRVSPILHKKAAICAASKGISLNSFVEHAISAYVRKCFAK